MTQLKRFLLYLTALIGFITGSLFTLEGLAQTWNFSGPVSYVTTAANNLRAQAVILVDADGNSVTGFTSGAMRVLATIANPSATTPVRVNAMVEGCVDEDEPATDCYPVYIGGRGSHAVPTAISLAGDAIAAWFSPTGEMHTIATYGTPTVTAVADSATNVTAVAANTARIGLKCTNTSTVAAYVKEGATATTASFSVIINPGTIFNWPQPVPTSIIDVIWASDPNTGSIVCTEGLR